MESDEFEYTHMRKIQFAKAYQIEEDKDKWPNWITDNEDIYETVYAKYTRSLIKPFVSVVGDWVVLTSHPTELLFIPDARFTAEYVALDEHKDEYLTEEEVMALGLTEDEIEWIEYDFDEEFADEN